MCSGACVLYKVKRVVIGENTTFTGAEEFLKQNGIEVVVLQDRTSEILMRDFIRDHPDIWSALQLRLRLWFGVCSGCDISLTPIALGMRTLAKLDHLGAETCTPLSGLVIYMIGLDMR